MRETFGLDQHQRSTAEHIRRKAGIGFPREYLNPLAPDRSDLSASLKVQGTHPNRLRKDSELDQTRQVLQYESEVVERNTNNATPKHFTVKMNLFLASQNKSYPLQISLPKDITVGDAIAYSVDEFNNKVTS